MRFPHNFDRLASELELGGFVGSIGFVPTDSKGRGAQIEIPDTFFFRTSKGKENPQVIQKKCVFWMKSGIYPKNIRNFKLKDCGGDFRASWIILGSSQIPRFPWIQSSSSESAGRQRTGALGRDVMVHISLVSKIWPTYPWKVPRTFTKRFMKKFLSLWGFVVWGIPPQGCFFWNLSPGCPAPVAPMCHGWFWSSTLEETSETS